MEKLRNIKRRLLSSASLGKSFYSHAHLDVGLADEGVKEKFSRIGTITDDYIYQGLRYEADIFALSCKNYKANLRYGQLDFLLVTSLIESSEGEWNFSTLDDEIDKVIELARQEGVPSVFWLTKGMRYFDRYLCLSKKFDYVYCADNACKDEFRKHGVNACLLLPCVQPLIFNPLKTRSQNISDDGDSFYSYALFNGWADIDRFENHYSKIFDNEIIGSMRIIESRCIITRNRVEGLERW